MKFIISSLCILLSTFLANADITATVTPGYQFGATERPTTSTLNLLARPTIFVSGTLGGTNVAISAGSVTGVQLSDTVVDGTNLEYNSSSPRAIHVKNGGITSTQLNASTFTYPLAGGGGTNVGLATNSVTLPYFRTNIFDSLVTRTDLPVNLTTNGTGTTNLTAGTNTWLLLATTTTQGTNGSPTNTTFAMIPVTNFNTFVSNVAAAAVTPTLGNFRGFTNGVGTNLTIVRSYNVSNVWRTAAGNYTITFSNSFANTNYVLLATVLGTNASNLQNVTAFNQRTNQVALNTGVENVSVQDVANVSFVIYP